MKKILQTLTISTLLALCSCANNSEDIAPSNIYYQDHKVSLVGSENNNSDADALFSYMLAQSKSDEDIRKWGKKFFVVFVQEDCASCDWNYKAFEILENNWGKGEFVSPTDIQEDFKLYTIYCDTTTSDDSNIFLDYFYPRYGLKFDQVAETMAESDYAKNLGDRSTSYLSDLESLTRSDTFATITSFLYDPNGKNKTELGVSEVLFVIPGKGNESGAYPQARTLFDCWYHQDLFNAQ